MTLKYIIRGEIVLDINIKNIWIDNKIIKEDTENYFKLFNSEMEKLYQFVITYYDYMYTKRDYGNGTPMTMLEIHVLTDINDNPGITITELSNKWKRTTSAISQIIKMCYSLDLVERIRNKDDGKINNLFITDKGAEIVLKHKHYDNIDTIKVLKKLNETHSQEEILSFFAVLDTYKKILKNTKKS